MNGSFGKTLINWNEIIQLEKRIMGTRGAYGFFINGETRVSYNHYDSYPSTLGEAVLAFVRSMDLQETRKKAAALRRVKEDSAVTKADIQLCTRLDLVDTSVGDTQKGRPDWYQLLRKGQGKLDKMLAVGVYIESRDFLDDSLFCEWAYVVNLDSRELEVYRGFQKEAHQEGRYAGAKAEGCDYYSVALIKTFSFDRLPPEGKLESIVEESDIEQLAREGSSP